MLLTANLSAQYVPTWNVGTPIASSVVATLKNDTLTISGTGTMENYVFPSKFPWTSFYSSDVVAVHIQEGVKTIGDFAFAELPHVTSVTIPNSVTSIGQNAFENCRSLTSITIPSSVISIGWSAFDGCTGLTEIVSLAAVPPTLEGGIFWKVDTVSCILSVGSVAAYQAAIVWNSFENILPCNFSEFAAMIMAFKADTAAKNVAIAAMQVQNSTLTKSNTNLQTQKAT